jgi:hypothetical protein
VIVHSKIEKVWQALCRRAHGHWLTWLVFRNSGFLLGVGAMHMDKVQIYSSRAVGARFGGWDADSIIIHRASLKYQMNWSQASLWERSSIQGHSIPIQPSSHSAFLTPRTKVERQSHRKKRTI